MQSENARTHMRCAFSAASSGPAARTLLTLHLRRVQASIPTLLGAHHRWRALSAGLRPSPRAACLLRSCCAFQCAARVLDTCRERVNMGGGVRQDAWHGRALQSPRGLPLLHAARHSEAHIPADRDRCAAKELSGDHAPVGLSVLSWATRTRVSTCRQCGAGSAAAMSAVLATRWLRASGALSESRLSESRRARCMDSGRLCGRHGRVPHRRVAHRLRHQGLGRRRLLRRELPRPAGLAARGLHRAAGRRR